MATCHLFFLFFFINSNVIMHKNLIIFWYKNI
nr:MAG TPA: hypothetical protein [Caudoviricetes sp.]